MAVSSGSDCAARVTQWPFIDLGDQFIALQKGRRQPAEFAKLDHLFRACAVLIVSVPPREHHHERRSDEPRLRRGLVRCARAGMPQRFARKSSDVGMSYS
jgi:hypothetical protein